MVRKRGGSTSSTTSLFEMAPKVYRNERPVGQESLEALLERASKIDIQTEIATQPVEISPLLLPEEEALPDNVGEVKLLETWIRTAIFAALSGRNIPRPPTKIEMAWARGRAKFDKGWERSVLTGNRAVLKQLPEEDREIWAVVGPDSELFQTLSKELATEWYWKARSKGEKVVFAKRWGHGWKPVETDCNDNCIEGLGI